MHSDEDDAPCLSAETFKALQEFYTEQAKKEEIIQSIQQSDQSKENFLFDEDWQLSQFWYDEKTIQNIAKVVKKIIPTNGRLGLLCCPTLYKPIERILDNQAEVKLFEYDRRFEVYGSNFIHYDYNHPLKLPPDCHQFDVLIADPPFLSSECLAKVSQTIKKLAKDKIILCTGTVMATLAQELLHLKMCEFKPEHKNNLANEFSCYTNFDLDTLLISD